MKEILRSVADGAWATLFRLRHVSLQMLVAMCLAILVWLYTRSRDQEDTLDMIPVPVNFTLATAAAPHYDLEIHGSNRVLVSFTGPPTRIREVRRQLQRGTLQIALNLAIPEERQHETSYRDLVRVLASDVPVPAGVTAVVTEGRNVVAVSLHRLVERHLPVRLDYLGEDRITQIKLEPATVVVRGPKEVLDHTRAIATQPLVLPAGAALDSESDHTLRGNIALVADVEGRRIQANPGSVAYRFHLHPKQKTYELADVPVRFLCPLDFPYRPRFAADQPAKVTLQVVGPTSEEPPRVQAFVDLTRGALERGRNVEPLRLQLPRDFQLLHEVPRVVFHLDPLVPDGD
jgi:hypothetical protein